MSSPLYVPTLNFHTLMAGKILIPLFITLFICIYLIIYPYNPWWVKFYTHVCPWVYIQTYLPDYGQLGLNP